MLDAPAGEVSHLNIAVTLKHGVSQNVRFIYVYKFKLLGNYIHTYLYKNVFVHFLHFLHVGSSVSSPLLFVLLDILDFVQVPGFIAFLVEFHF